MPSFGDGFERDDYGVQSLDDRTAYGRGVLALGNDLTPVVEAKARPNQADLAVTLLHEYAHALPHFDVDDEAERSKREVEAEAVAYIVGRFFGLDTSGSAFYLAAWQDDDPEVVQDRLGRISSTAQEIIGTVAEG